MQIVLESSFIILDVSQLVPHEKYRKTTSGTRKINKLAPCCFQTDRSSLWRVIPRALSFGLPLPDRKLSPHRWGGVYHCVWRGGKWREWNKSSAKASLEMEGRQIQHYMKCTCQLHRTVSTYIFTFTPCDQLMAKYIKRGQIYITIP